MPNGTYGGVRGRKTKEIGGKLRKSFVFLLLDFNFWRDHQFGYLFERNSCELNNRAFSRWWPKPLIISVVANFLDPVRYNEKVLCA